MVQEENEKQNKMDKINQKCNNGNKTFLDIIKKDEFATISTVNTDRLSARDSTTREINLVIGKKINISRIREADSGRTYSHEEWKCNIYIFPGRNDVWNEGIGGKDKHGDKAGSSIVAKNDLIAHINEIYIK